MGAAAITTNAGSVLILTDSGNAFLESLLPFMKGMTLFTWAWATWWIPVLILFGVWKHFTRRVPLTYTPMLWSLVFPLGMYTVASLRLSNVANFALLRQISLGMVWIAFGVWILTSMGLLGAAWKSARSHFRTS
jgi:tellurite resistance protein TehA-like permease